MAHLDHFAYGAITPLLAYGLSVLGSLLGLISTRRARIAVTGGQRARWLAMAAFAIGGTGIWVMHFMAMIGFTVDGGTVTYDPAITVASFLTAVIVVGIGLFIVGYGRPRWWKIMIAGIFTGVGVAGMHYTGMAAMRVPGTIGYERNLFDASIAIAVVAATAALWFTVNIRRPVLIVVAAAIMGVAVSGMHYTGMAALYVLKTGVAPKAGGVTPLTFLVPIFVFVLFVMIALAYAMMANPQGIVPVPEESLQDRLAAAAPAPASAFAPANGSGYTSAAGTAYGPPPTAYPAQLPANGYAPAPASGYPPPVPTGTFADGDIPTQPRANGVSGPPGSGLGSSISLRGESSGTHRR